MRPLKLTITAFGPYATQQIIDFTQLQGRNLFVITGDTGAGKTTILDAIAYALYGKASGRDRDGESLRSHFASPDLLTSVEMEFTISAQRYWVQRIPKQRKKRTRGEGYTDQNVEAEFKALHGDSNVISGVKEVNEKIVELIGLSYEQFKQIIMIPQGEFRELLNADSKARQDILQKIFGTEGFRRVQELFDSETKTLNQEVSRLESQRNECVRSLDGSGDVALAALLELPDFNITMMTDNAKQAIDKDNLIANGLQAQVYEQEQRVADKQGEIFQGKANNSKIIAREDASQKKIAMELCCPQIDEKRRQSQLGRKALGLKTVDEYRYNREVHMEKMKVELAKAVSQEEKANVAVDVGHKNYQLEIAKEGRRNELLAEQAKLQGLSGKVADWDFRQAKATRFQQDLILLKKSRDTTKKELEKTREDIKNGQIRLDKIRTITIECASKVIELEKTNAIFGKIETLKTENDRLVTLQQSVAKLEQQQAAEHLKFKQAQINYEVAQNLFFEGQAGLLASKLITGNPCPVCGSAHHPHLAGMMSAIPSEAELRELIQRDKQARKLYDEANGQYGRIKAEHYAQHQIIFRLQKELDVIVTENVSEISPVELAQYIATKLPEYQRITLDLRDEVKKLLNQKEDEKELSATLLRKTESVNILATQLDRLEGQYTELFAKVESAKDAMKALEAEVPITVRSTKALAEALGRIKTEYDGMSQALKTAEQQLRDRQVEQASVRTEKKGIEKALLQGEVEFAIAQQNFMKAIDVAGFTTEEEYIQGKLTEDVIVSLENEISDFQERLRSAVDYYVKMMQEVEGLSVSDVAKLEAEYLELQTIKNGLITQRTAIVARQVHNQTMLTSICALVKRLEDKEQEHELIGHLARIARGDNEQKVSFERYVLAAFFNDIIDAANVRLKKMTSGRYQMSRITQKGKGGGQSGLEIEVFDYYTGQSRHVKTLSGGESFKASLALALGLAEVVQSYAGGINLETMFVDEGFGTLDPESLDTAISCLIDLQHSGRLVGIISHVPELKTSVDARLEIEACTDGSRAKFCIM